MYTNPRMAKTKTRIVILGAGFAGMAALRHLTKKLDAKNVEITMVNRTNHFLFTPLIHEVATGALGRSHVVEPIRKFIDERWADFRQAEVESIDMPAQVVKTSHGDISYDYLLVGLGATTNFFDTPGAQEHCFVLKTLRDAVTIKNHCIDLFEEVSQIDDRDERRKRLTFTVIGGGPTGVELAAEMADLLFDTFDRYYRNIICRQEITINLVHSRDRLLNSFPDHLRDRAADVLRRKGVTLHLGQKAKSVTADVVQTLQGDTIPSHTTVWTSGVTAVPVPIEGAALHDRSGRIMVNQGLQVPQHPNVYVAGDIAHVTMQGSDKPLPMLAQVAKQAGNTAATNIVRATHGQHPKRFVYRSKGNLASLGQWQALAHVLGMQLSGFFAWFVWRTIYLANFASWSKRLQIAVDWTVNFFSPRDITKL